MDVKEKLIRILKDLEEVRSKISIKSLEKAIEDIKIAINELEKIERKGLESLDHYSAKAKILEMIGGTYYLEAEHTKISKIGYRPDVVVIKDDEVVLIEIERDRRRFINRIKKIKKFYDKILNLPILANRRLRIVFGIVGFEINQDVIKELKRLDCVEVYKIANDKIEKIY